MELRILLLLLYFCSVQSLNQDSYNIENYDAGPGLFYENIGKANIYIKDFNMLTYYDLEKYYNNYRDVVKLTNQVQKYCSTAADNTCKNFLFTSNKTLITLEQKDALIKDIVGIPDSLVRRKRFFGFLATVATGIFGIIKGNQEQRAASREISKYREEVNKLQEMVANQMYLYQNLQRDVNDKFSKVSDELSKINKNLKGLYARFNQQFGQIELLRAMQSIDSLTQIFASEQSDLLDCLILARQGVLHPMIISPTMLKNKLLEVKELIKYDKEMSKIIENSVKDANALFNMIKPVIYVENKTIVFDLSIPLIAESLYQIYKLTSAPVAVSDNVYAYIYPENPYMFVDTKNERHFFLDKQEFDECKLVNEKEYVCKRLKPLRIRKLTCEHMLISDDERMPENCDIRMIKISRTLFIELERERSWIVVAPKQERLSLFCDQLIHNVEVGGTGVINVDSNCGTTQAGDIILRDFSTNNLNISQNYDVFKPRGNLKKHVEHIDLTHLSSTMNLMVLSRAETVKLQYIGTPISTLYKTEQFYSVKSATSHNILLYLICILCVIQFSIMVFLYFSFRTMKNTSDVVNLPKPLMLLSKEQGTSGNSCAQGNIYQ